MTARTDGRALGRSSLRGRPSWGRPGKRDRDPMARVSRCVGAPRGLRRDRSVARRDPLLRRASWISRAARMPDSSAPWIHAWYSEQCSPAKWMRPSGVTMSACSSRLLLRREQRERAARPAVVVPGVDAPTS